MKFEKEDIKEEFHFRVDISKGSGLIYGGNKFWILTVYNKKWKMMEQIYLGVC